MNYLLDSNVVSALRGRGSNPEVETWSNSVPAAAQFVSASLKSSVVLRQRRAMTQNKVTYCAPGSTKCCCLVSQDAFCHSTFLPLTRWGLSEYLNMRHSMMR